MAFAPKEVCNQILAKMEELTLAANGDISHTVPNANKRVVFTNKLRLR